MKSNFFTTCEDNRRTMTDITGGGGRGEESDLFRYGGIVTRSTGVRDTAVVTDDGVVCYPCKVPGQTFRPLSGFLPPRTFTLTFVGAPEIAAYYLFRYTDNMQFFLKHKQNRISTA